MKKLIPILIIAMTQFLISQNHDTYNLKWKLNPGEEIVYQLDMEYDTLIDSESLNKLFESTKDTFHFLLVKEMMNLFKEQLKDINLVSYLKLNDKGIIDIIIKNQNSSSSDILWRNEILAAINPNGELFSFWLPIAQKNLVALLFELPPDPVKIGES